MPRSPQPRKAAIIAGQYPPRQDPRYHVIDLSTQAPERSAAHLLAALLLVPEGWGLVCSPIGLSFASHVPVKVHTVPEPHPSNQSVMYLPPVQPRWDEHFGRVYLDLDDGYTAKMVFAAMVVAAESKMIHPADSMRLINTGTRLVALSSADGGRVGTAWKSKPALWPVQDGDAA